MAGVPHIVMTTPPGKDGKVCASTLVAAKEAGADEIYKVGGAQAIGREDGIGIDWQDLLIRF